MNAVKADLLPRVRVREDDPRIDIAHDLAAGDVVHLQTEKHYLTGRWAPDSFALFHKDPMTVERVETLGRGELLMLWFTRPLPGSARYRCSCGCGAWTGDRFLLARPDQEVLRSTEAGQS